MENEPLFQILSSLAYADKTQDLPTQTPLLFHPQDPPHRFLWVRPSPYSCSSLVSQAHGARVAEHRPKERGENICLVHSMELAGSLIPVASAFPSLKWDQCTFPLHFRDTSLHKGCCYLSQLHPVSTCCVPGAVLGSGRAGLYSSAAEANK